MGILTHWLKIMQTVECLANTCWLRKLPQLCHSFIKRTWVYKALLALITLHSEIHHQILSVFSELGCHETFIVLTPYLPLFQWWWLQLCELPQATHGWSFCTYVVWVFSKSFPGSPLEKTMCQRLISAHKASQSNIK